MRRETQAGIAQWRRDTFGDNITNARLAARANREMSELLGKLTLDPAHPGAAEEVADVVIVLCSVMDRLGADLLDEVDRKMAVNRAREWVVADGDGRHRE